MNDSANADVKMNDTAERGRLKSYRVILNQAARAIKNVFWAARHGMNFDRRMTIRIGLLLALTLFLQASVAMSLIMASKLISGEAVTIWKFSFEAADRQTAVLIAFGAILVIMLVVAVTNFATSVFLRRLGRSIHTDALKTVIDKLDRQSPFDGFELAKINRVLFQASLHLGIATETIFRMVQPLLIICSATVALIALDPWLLPIIALLALPILPVYLRESRRLVQFPSSFSVKAQRILAGSYRNMSQRHARRMSFRCRMKRVRSCWTER